MGWTSSARLFRMDGVLIFTLATALLQETLATNFKTQNDGCGPTVELIADIRSVLQGISQAFDAENRITRLETEIQAAKKNFDRFQEDLVDVKTKIQETSQAGQLLKAQFDTTVALLGKVSDDRRDPEVCTQTIQNATGHLSANLESLEARLAELETSVAKANGTVVANAVAVADLRSLPSRVAVLESNGQALNQSFNEFKTLVEDVKTTGARATCPESFQLVKDDCLFVVAKDRFDWSGARTNCKDKARAHGLKGDLAVPSDIPAFLDFMKKNGGGTSWPWIGASAVDDQATKWEWVTGATLDQSDFPWDKSEPTKSSTEKALCLQQSNLKFHNCGNSLQLQSVCQIFL